MQPPSHHRHVFARPRSRRSLLAHASHTSGSDSVGTPRLLSDCVWPTKMIHPGPAILWSRPDRNIRFVVGNLFPKEALLFGVRLSAALFPTVLAHTFLHDLTLSTLIAGHGSSRLLGWDGREKRHHSQGVRCQHQPSFAPRSSVEVVGVPPYLLPLSLPGDTRDSLTPTRVSLELRKPSFRSSGQISDCRLLITNG
ncbi:hypothetical protein LZ30DRAFT_462172 [Colletotrichum cereale]|nr:hypothetical protein LZ30DRAFT_462172 [Colletotrichum cereale]